MKRRQLLRGAASGVLVPVGLPMLPAWAQPSAKVARIGCLSAPSRASVSIALDAFLVALRALGWVEGRNMVIEYRWAEGQVARLPELAAELVRLKVDLIVAPAASAALAAKQATSTVPIVMIFPIDPVASGLIASLSRPGGNVTGTASATGAELSGKQLQVLKEVVPQAARMAFLHNPDDASEKSQAAILDAAGRSMGLRLRPVLARGPDELDAAFASMAKEMDEAVIVGRAAIFTVHAAKVAELALQSRLPSMYAFRESVQAGGLLSYAVNQPAFIGRAATYVDKILKGALPADLPVEQPTQFELVINLKAARALGPKVPSSLLLRADEVIQ
ncbi:MAG: ABC transporter substrate-binding protein [Burkholderiales bacterium]